MGGNFSEKFSHNANQKNVGCYVYYQNLQENLLGGQQYQAIHKFLSGESYALTNIHNW